MAVELFLTVYAVLFLLFGLQCKRHDMLNTAWAFVASIILFGCMFALALLWST